jgi:hypothetical protein
MFKSSSLCSFPFEKKRYEKRNDRDDSVFNNQCNTLNFFAHENKENNEKTNRRFAFNELDFVQISLANNKTTLEDDFLGFCLCLHVSSVRKTLKPRGHKNSRTLYFFLKLIFIIKLTELVASKRNKS